MLWQRVVTAVVLLLVLLPALFYPSPEPFCLVAWSSLRPRLGVGAPDGIRACAWPWPRGCWLPQRCAVAWRGAGWPAAAGSVGGGGLLWVLGGGVVAARRPGGAARLPQPVRLVLGLCCAVPGLAGGGAGAGDRHQLSAVGHGAGVGRRHRCLFRRAPLGRPLDPAQAGAEHQPRQELGGCWGGMLGVLVLVDAVALGRPVGRPMPRASTPIWHTGTGLLCVASCWFLTAMSVVGDLLESLVKRVRRRQGQQPRCCRATAACWTAWTRCCRPCRWRCFFTPCELHRMIPANALPFSVPPARSGSARWTCWPATQMQFEVFALTAATRVDEMLAQCCSSGPQFAVMSSPAHAAELARRCETAGMPTRVLSGPESLSAVASDERVDIVMAAIVGAAGLASCMAAALAGKRLLLANKEALVVGGEVFMAAVREGGAKLLPIDSEHSAIFQSLPDPMPGHLAAGDRQVAPDRLGWPVSDP
jgi:hypothetical protein